MDRVSRLPFAPMKPHLFAWLLLVSAFVAFAEEPSRLQLPPSLGHNMVFSLRTDAVRGEPAKPVLAFHVWKRKDERVDLGRSTVTLGRWNARFELLTKAPPRSDPGWWECRVDEWKKVAPLDEGPMDLGIRLVFRDRKVPPLEARWTNVLAGRVWLLGDRPHWGVAAEPTTTNPPVAAVLRVKVVGVEPALDWVMAEPAWMDSARNPLPVSPQVKAIIARLLATPTPVPTGLVVFPAASIRSDQPNRMAIPQGEASAGPEWLRLVTDEAGEGAKRFDRQRALWLDAAGLAQRHGRVLDPMEAVRPEPPLVFIPGNFDMWPITVDATVW
jgi:hypothetical protein